MDVSVVVVVVVVFQFVSSFPWSSFARVWRSWPVVPLPTSSWNLEARCLFQLLAQQ